jgi:uncharacterized lipoprotein YmbA
MRRLLLAACLLSPVACSVKAPPRQSWTIVTRRMTAEAPRDAALPALGVTRFSAAPDVRTTDLTWRDQDGRQLHATDDRWADYPDRMMEEMVRDALIETGAFSVVASAPPTEGLDALLSARVVDFTEWHDADAMTVRVAVSWRLRQPMGFPLAQKVEEHSAVVAQKSVAGVVAAYQEAAQACAHAMAAEVATSAAAAKTAAAQGH